MNYKPFKISSTKSSKDSSQEIAKLLRPFIHKDYVNYSSTEQPYFIFFANNRKELREVCNHVSAEIFGLQFNGDPQDLNCLIALISFKPIQFLEVQMIFNSLKETYYAK